MCVCSDRNPKGSSQPKVGQLDGSLLVNKEVLRFQVTMEHTARVAKHNPLQDLVRVALWRGDTNRELDLQHRVLLSFNYQSITFTSMGSKSPCVVSIYFFKSICINSNTR